MGVVAGLAVLVAAPANAADEDLTSRIAGATIGWEVGTIFIDTYRRDGVWLRAAIDAEGAVTEATGTWWFERDKKGRKVACWKMTGLLKSCSRLLRRGSSYYEADETGEFRVHFVKLDR